GHHADLQLLPAAPVFRPVRRGDPALGREEDAGAGRRRGGGPRVRRRPGGETVPAPGRGRRAGTARLRPRPGPPDPGGARAPAVPRLAGAGASVRLPAGAPRREAAPMIRRSLCALLLLSSALEAGPAAHAQIRRCTTGG